MKLTRKQLKSLITEVITEQSSVLLEAPYDSHDHDDDEGLMVKKELFHIAQKAQQLHDILMDDEELDPGVQSKIAKAAAMVGSVFDHMMYTKHPGHVKE